MSPKYNDEQRIGSLGMFNVRMKSWGLCGEHHYYVCVWSEVGSEVWHVIMLVDSAWRRVLQIHGCIGASGRPI